MALPTTDLTAHFDASDTDKVFTTLNGGGSGVHTGTPGDGDSVQAWDDEGDGSASDLVWAYVSNGPEYRSGTPLMQLPCLDFNPASSDIFQLYTQNGGSGKSVDTLISASQFTVAMSLYVEGIVNDANSANVYANNRIWGDVGGYVGLFLRTNGSGQYYLQLYNWDGNQDYTELEISLNTSYVVIAHHEGGTLYMTLITDGAGTEINTDEPYVSGDTQVTENFAQISGTADSRFNGRIGEMAFYNVAKTGSELTDLKQYFYGKWFPATARRWILRGH